MVQDAGPTIQSNEVWPTIGVDGRDEATDEDTLNDLMNWLNLPDVEVEVDNGHLDSFGSTSHLSERSKSVSIMCPSSLTNTFSGLRSLYTMPNMCRYSNANNTSAA